MAKETNLDKLVDKIQRSILEDERKIYSDTVRDHAYNPRNVGEIKDAKGFSIITGPCGDTMQIYLNIKGSEIIDCKFLTDGCGASVACGSVTTELVKGKTVKEASKIKSDKIMSILGGLPEDNVHCTVLAENTLRAAIDDYNSRRCKP